ncbi:hypothetical protein ASPZODRAFT_127671 [Penicilliopsis zonata CBS 506.65]|uniref:Uncharacterized protein n=1 Tax=Penicilliopsis zonata CBS 506.65 TaxID=1073090 RepID=A0A1L9SWK3_9EURO|nr:hypothetical protein ASPZODRAFT_127671 [Penicilliopsis zonata CBS 506.65]OJJ51578.1 hypothetical protein ASPZODRAFT_127671 [Penicilliopsis zonata CBS 506.65]
MSDAVTPLDPLLALARSPAPVKSPPQPAHPIPSVLNLPSVILPPPTHSPKQFPHHHPSTPPLFFISYDLKSLFLVVWRSGSL